jgi:PAS domain S-box-containing protein
MTDENKSKAQLIALQESEERLRAVWEIAADAIMLSDPEGIVIAANPAYCQLFGYSAEEVIGQSFAIIFPPERRNWVVERYKTVFSGQTVPPPTLEVRICQEGSRPERVVEARIGFITKEGQRTGMLSITRDITERKQMEEALQQRNRELALLNRTSQGFNSSLDLDEVITNVLEEVRPLLGVFGASIWLIDPQTGELVCQQASGDHAELVRGWRVPPGVGIVGWVAQHDQSQIVPDTHEDPRHFRKVEQKINLEIRSLLGIPLRTKQTMIGVLEVVDIVPHRFKPTDLTLVESLAATAAIAIENARLYEQTRQDAHTKTMLLQEVNHRVKNNLTAIIGLLHLEQNYMKAENQAAYQPIMQDLISRIHGLAAAHRLLSAGDWFPVLLSELTSKVIDSALQALPLDKQVAVEIISPPIRVSPKLANTLALVINELTTNTVKYAWPAYQSGCIVVRIKSEDDEIVLFEFRDNGRGFPEDVLRLERRSAGWELIQTLVRRGLRGEVSFYNDHGAVTVLRFPLSV